MESIERIIPGNYFLTKSMEWATETFKDNQRNIKISLKEYWAMKKFLVYYSYVFSKNSDFETDEVYKEVENNFTEFISSLDEEDKEIAEQYFFYRDIRNLNNIVKWTDFYDYTKQPNDKKELYDYKIRAKKLYWMYLIGIGGQSEIKKDVLHNWIPNGVKYHELFSKIEIDERRKQPTNGVLNDVAGPLRNIRQLYFYYGIFYKFKLNRNIEEYSTTQIGDLLVKGNINEMTIIMEHQKLRMLSQPPNVKIKDVLEVASDTFFIEINPYLKILKYLSNNKELKTDYFMFVLSRHIPINSELTLSKKHINGFMRKGDKVNTDFTKELKKYLHGLNKIKGVNIKTGSSRHNNTDIEGMKKYYNYLKFYKKIKKKDIQKYMNGYKELLRKNYFLGKVSEKYSELKSWYSYITVSDKALLFSLLIYNLENNESASSKFPHLYLYLKLNKEITNEAKQINKNNISGNSMYVLYNSYFYNESDIENNYKGEKLKIKSVEYMISKSNQRFNLLEANERKHINIIKNFYIYSNVTKCDCCGNKTFLNKNNNPYLEYHHLVPLSNNGTDHVLNIFGICPMCHRKFHHCNKSDRKKMYEDLKRNDTLVNIDKDTYSLFNRYKYLYDHDKINLLGIEFLIDEGLFSKEQAEEIILN